MLPRLCNFCKKKETKLSKCSRCKCTLYCSGECQKSDWITHKSLCSGGDLDHTYCSRLKDTIESLELDELYCDMMYTYRLGMFPHLSLSRVSAKRILLGKEKIPRTCPCLKAPIDGSEDKRVLYISVGGRTMTCILKSQEDDMVLMYRTITGDSDKSKAKFFITMNLVRDIWNIQPPKVKALHPRARLVSAYRAILSFWGYNCEPLNELFEMYSKSGREVLINAGVYVIALNHSVIKAMYK